MLMHLLNFFKMISIIIGYVAWGYFFIHMLEKIGKKTNSYFISVFIVVIIMISMTEAAEWILSLE